MKERGTELQEAIQQAAAHPSAARLMTHPGVGPLTSLSFVLTIGRAESFRRSRDVSGYLGLDPSEKSSGNRRRIGAISPALKRATREGAFSPA